MHPIERLRMVARAGREDPTALAREAASALAAFADDPAALVTACRRLLDRQPTCGPLWWLAARVLSATDPADEAWHAADELYRDPTPTLLADALPEEGTVAVLGWPDQAAQALMRRGDARVLVVDALDEGAALARWLRRADGDAELVPESGAAAAAAATDLVLLEAVALGAPDTPEPSAPSGPPDSGGLVAVAGSAAAAAVANRCRIPVWAVAGVGRVLPPPLWDALTARLRERGSAWDQDEHVVPLEWVDAVAGPDGVQPVAHALARPTCPTAPELVSVPRR